MGVQGGFMGEGLLA